MSADDMRTLRTDIAKSVGQERGAQSEEAASTAMAKAEGERSSGLRKEEEKIARAHREIIGKAGDDQVIQEKIRAAQENVTKLSNVATLAGHASDYYSEQARRRRADVTSTQTALDKALEEQKAQSAQLATAVTEATTEIHGAIGRRGTGFIPNLISDENTAKKLMGDYRSQQSRERRLMNDLRRLTREDNESGGTTPTT